MPDRPWQRVHLSLKTALPAASTSRRPSAGSAWRRHPAEAASRSMTPPDRPAPRAQHGLCGLSAPRPRRRARARLNGHDRSHRTSPPCSSIIESRARCARDAPLIRRPIYGTVSTCRPSSRSRITIDSFSKAPTPDRFASSPVPQPAQTIPPGEHPGHRRLLRIGARAQPQDGGARPAAVDHCEGAARRSCGGAQAQPQGGRVVALLRGRARSRAPADGACRSKRRATFRRVGRRRDHGERGNRVPTRPAARASG